MNIYVGNLAKETSAEELTNEFAAFGKVSNVKVIKDMMSGESKGFAFVDMPVDAEAEEAIKNLNAKEVNGRKLVVNVARPKTDSHGNNRGGGRPGGRPGGNSRGGNFDGNRSGGGRPGFRR
ncbi:MAG: RNA-binding protein [Ignavibacteria bacterium]|nr:RNA-binding protein [Ignavibacteria bacterium]